MSDISLKPFLYPITATLNLPGSKSIANRVLLLSALASGESIIANVPNVAEDVTMMLDALVTLGVTIIKLSNTVDATTYKIIGCDGIFSVKDCEIFCGNSGTTIRFLCAVLSLMDGNYILTGIKRMKERPIIDLVGALQQIGADITYLEVNGYPPIQIKPYKPNHNQHIKIRGSTSSQYLTSLLMALPLLNQDYIIDITDNLISKPYVDITLGLMKLFNCIGITNHNYKHVTIKATNRLLGQNYVIEPDASSASYFMAMGALSGSVIINNLSQNSLQGDKNFAQVLAQMGAHVEHLPNAIKIQCNGKLNGISIDMEDMPDVAMTLAVLTLFASGNTVITGIQSWKVKETDRLQAMYNELTKLGATVIIANDSITVYPPENIQHNVVIDTYNDHRMAMSFSLLAVGGVPVTINDYECVAKTFANYFDVFNELYEKTI